MGDTHDLVAALHRLASVAPIDEAPTLIAAARKIVMLRRQNTGLRDHVLPSIHRVLGCLFPDREHQERGPMFREFRKNRDVMWSRPATGDGITRGTTRRAMPLRSRLSTTPLEAGHGNCRSFGYMRRLRAHRQQRRAKSYIGAQGIDLAELTDEEAVALIESERRRQMIRNAIGPPNGR